MPAIGSLVTDQARQSAAFVSLLLSSLLGALLAPGPIAASPAPFAPASTIGLARAAAKLATPAEIVIASTEADEDGTGAGDPPAVAGPVAQILPLPGSAADPGPLEPRLRIALPAGHGFSARAPPRR